MLTDEHQANHLRTLRHIRCLSGQGTNTCTHRARAWWADCNCRESGESAVQREAGGHSLRPLHCALIKYNRYNPPQFNSLPSEAATSLTLSKPSAPAADRLTHTVSDADVETLRITTSKSELTGNREVWIDWGSVTFSYTSRTHLVTFTMFQHSNW